MLLIEVIAAVCIPIRARNGYLSHGPGHLFKRMINIPTAPAQTLFVHLRTVYFCHKISVLYCVRFRRITSMGRINRYPTCVPRLFTPCCSHHSHRTSCECLCQSLMSAVYPGSTPLPPPDCRARSGSGCCGGGRSSSGPGRWWEPGRRSDSETLPPPPPVVRQPGRGPPRGERRGRRTGRRPATRWGRFGGIR